MDVHRGFTERLQAWGNSPRAPLIWGTLGCICSFFTPMFPFSNEPVSDVDCIRLTTMLLSCAAAAAMYRVAFVLRHDSLMREKPGMFGRMLGSGVYCCIYIVIGGIFAEEGTWPTVVGLQLLAVAVFVLLEMARPAVDFFVLRFFVCLPIIAGARRHGWDFIHFGWPVIVVAMIFLLRREFFIEHRGSRV